MEKEENRLGTEKIGKLLLAFAIPCVISMVVNSIYNMVDQIFIGWGVGYLGNGATNIIFPLNMVCLAFALMLGDGTSAFLSLKLNIYSARTNIFTTIIKSIWMYRHIKTICIRLWICTNIWITIHDDRYNIKLNYKS